MVVVALVLVVVCRAVSGRLVGAAAGVALGVGRNRYRRCVICVCSVSTSVRVGALRVQRGLGAGVVVRPVADVVGEEPAGDVVDVCDCGARCGVREGLRPIWTQRVGRSVEPGPMM